MIYLERAKACASDKWLIKLLIANHSCKLLNAGRICHLENVKSYMSYLQQYTKIIKKLTLKTYFS